MAVVEGTVLKERYRVERVLGQGGMATVYLARDTHLDDAPVVVKVPKRFLLEDETGGSTGENRERFAREIRQLIKVRGHDGIVRILDQGDVGDLPFYVLEHQAGGSLADRLRAGPQDPAAVLAWLAPVAAALDDIARLGLVHRDVKPDNILFAEPPAAGQHDPRRARLSDFGIVKALGDSLHGKTGNTYIGTLEYMAPEQADPRADLTGACDQYALAATAYEALAGCIPHHGTPRLELPGVRRSRPPDPLGTRTLAGHVPAGAAAAVARGLSVDARERFPSCTAFAEAFAAALSPAPQGSATRRLAPPDPGPEAPPAGRRWLAPTLSVLVVGAALAAVLHLTGILGGTSTVPGGPGGGSRVEPGAAPAPVRLRLAVTAPLPGALLRAATVEVAGTLDADPPAGAKVMLRGQPLRLSGRAFAGTWALGDAEGRLEAAITCEGPGLACDPALLWVEVDRTGPRWVEQEGQWLPVESSEDAVTLSIPLEDAHPVQVRSGESAWATVKQPDGTWLLKAVLPVPQQGETAHAFAAEDSLGNRAEPRRLVVRRTQGVEPWRVDLEAATAALVASRFTEAGARLAAARSKGVPGALVTAPLIEAERLLASAVRLPLRALPMYDPARVPEDPLDVVVAFHKENVQWRWRGDVDGQARTFLLLDAEPDGKLDGPNDGWWFGSASSPRGLSPDAGDVEQGVLSRLKEPFYERGAWRVLEVDGRNEVLVVRDPNARTFEESLGARWRDRNLERFRGMLKSPPTQTGEYKDAKVPEDPEHVPAPAWVFSADVSAVFARAARERRPVFVHIGRMQFSPPCRQMDFLSYSDPGVIEALKPFLCVRLDLDWVPRDALVRVGMRNVWPVLGFFDWAGWPLEVPEQDAQGKAVQAGVAPGGIAPRRLEARARAALAAWRQADREGFAAPAWASGLAKVQMDEARRLRVPVAFENALGMRFVLVPGGTFTMGGVFPKEISYAVEPFGATPHEVTLTPFFLQTGEVTNGEYRTVVPAHDSGSHEGKTRNDDAQPAIRVAWVGATQFAAELAKNDPSHAYRLPTEAEWERAARAGTKTPFWFGEAGPARLSRYANWCPECFVGVEDSPAERVQPGDPTTEDEFVWLPARAGVFRKSPWGLGEMTGNVGEWVEDWFAPYPTSPQQDPKGPRTEEAPRVPFDGDLEPPQRVVRGGAYNNAPAECRSDARAGAPPEKPSDYIGFRLAVPVPPR